MMDVGVSEKKLYGPETAGPKETNRIIYPSFSIKKDIGEFKFGETLTLTCKVVVEALEKDKRGVRTTFEVREIGIKKPTRDGAAHKAADDFLKK